MQADNDIDDPFDSLGAQQLAAWTLRLANDDSFWALLSYDPHLFAMLYASCAAAVEPPLRLRLGAAADPARAGEELLAALKDLQRQFGSSASGQFARLYLRGIAMHVELHADEGSFRNAAREWQRDAATQAGGRVTAQERNVELANVLGLDRVERDLLIFELSRHKPGFAQLFELLLSEDERTAPVLGLLLGCSPKTIESALSEGSTLVRSGLVRVQQRPLRVDAPSVHLRAVLTERAETDEEFFARFLVALTPKASTASLGRLDDRDRAILVALLKLPVPDEHGLHALVYGSESVDKRDMLARILASENLNAYVVASKNVPAGDLPAWVFIAQHRIARERGVLVVERAEYALSARPRSLLSVFGLLDDEEPSSSVEDEHASDEGLTSARLRCVWVTDHARSLTERNLARFLFHCEARPASRADRRERISAAISEHGLSGELERDLSKYSLLGDGQVRQAANLARLLHDEPAAREKVIRRAVNTSQTVLGRAGTERLRDSVTTYSLANLNLSGRFSAEQILSALREHPAGSLCFYGLPGAGKTQLAEYFAVELDLPIISKSASELLSMWLGETEQHIAAMFAEAEAEGALLFLDEADSFLRDRALARAEWAVTQVNELLQRMERHPGIFIAATNLMRDIDAAALRRFTWKMEFLALAPEQAWHMFCTEAAVDPAGGDPTHLEELAARLGAIENLTPGDFATVKRQANMLAQHLSPEDWLEQLSVEAKAKMLGLQRNKPGFA